MQATTRITRSFKIPGRLTTTKASNYTRRSVSTSATAAAAGPSDPHAYCRDYVQKHDYDSYLNSYFYPRYAQNGYFAIKAFSVRTTVKLCQLFTCSIS